MFYEFHCKCGYKVVAKRTIDTRDNAPICIHCRGESPDRGRSMRRVITVPQLVCEPYHLKEGNRWKGSAMDKLAYDRKYDLARQNNTEQSMKYAKEEAQRNGSEVVTKVEQKSLVQMAREQGVPIRG